MEWSVPVRGIKAEEFDTLVQWLTATQDQNMIDFGVLSYPRTSILVAGNGEPNLFMPFQQVFMLESLAPKPGINGVEFIKSLKSLIESVKEIANKHQVKELYFFGGDERVEKLGPYIGFEKMDLPCYRLRLRGKEDANT